MVRRTISRRKKVIFYEKSMDVLDETPPPEPIIELGRLICGLLEGEAQLSFILTDKDGRTLTVYINGIVFGD